MSSATARKVAVTSYPIDGNVEKGEFTIRLQRSFEVVGVADLKGVPHLVVREPGTLDFRFEHNVTFKLAWDGEAINLNPGESHLGSFAAMNDAGGILSLQFVQVFGPKVGDAAELPSIHRLS
jgi:hypothetical protein